MSTNSNVDGKAWCWMCLDAGLDSSGQPPRHECSCRGETGAVHEACLLEYAKRETEYFNANGPVCPVCKQQYNLDFRAALAGVVVTEMTGTFAVRAAAAIRPIRLNTVEATRRVEEVNRRYRAQIDQIMVESSRRRRAMVGALFALAAVAGYIAGRASRK